ncbi:MAG: hypothetical protein SchgKO_01980 [Schleiferiaceae bacterium]
MTKLKLLLCCLFFVPAIVQGQKDSVVFSQKQYLIGEVKEMNRGVLTFETDFSDDDFKIEWDEVISINTYRYYLITLKSGENIFGNISTDSTGIMSVRGVMKKFRAYTSPVTRNVDNEDIVYIKSLDRSFWKKLDASVDFGYSFTKASSLSQLNTRMNLGYSADFWRLSGSFSALRSVQDSVAPTERTEAQVDYNNIIKKNWFFLASGSFLSNTEQQLNLRSTGKLGIGNYLVRNNHLYFNVNAGLAGTAENYATETSNRESLEGFLGVDFNIFDIGDLSFSTVGTAYPSLTQARRFRFDLKADLKYDLPMDFYIKVGYSMNYDNQPAEGGTELDYIIQTNFGWEL